MATSSADRSDTAPALAGPFTLREIVVMAGAVLLLIGSVLPFEIGKGSYANVWTYHTTAFNQFVTLALPVVLGAAFAWRRLSGRTSVTAGSLTLDQLASVVSLLGILYFFISSVMSMNPAFLLGLLGSLVMSAGTAAAPYIPGFVLDFVPGQGALLTRPIRPTERRETSTAHGAPDPGSSGHTPAAGYGHTPAAAGHGHTPAAGQGHPASGADAHVTVAGGLAATHGATPEPVPGAWPRPDVSEEPVAADPAPATVAQAPAGTAVPDAAGSHRTDGSDDRAPGTSSEAAPGEAAAEAADEAESGTPASDADAAGGESGAPASDADAAGGESGAAGTAGAASAGGGTDTTTADGTAATAHEADPATSAVPSTATSALPAAGAGTGAGADASSDTAASGNKEEEMSFTATSSGQDTARQQAFWFAVPDRRTAVNEATGRNAFVLEPGEWILALEDRGYEFVVQDSDGTVGLLRDLGRIERA